MDKANIKKIAKILRNFTELESSFVLTEDIKAIRKASIQVDHDLVHEGMEIITPHGVFFDEMSFDEFKIRVGDMIEALGDSILQPQVGKPGKVIPILSPTGPLGGVEAGGEKIAPAPANTNPIVTRRISVSGFGKNGANGTLFDEKDIEIVSRGNLIIEAPDGSVIGKADKNGMIRGEAISGIIYKNGKYTLTDKSNVGKVIIVCQVQKK